MSTTLLKNKQRPSSSDPCKTAVIYARYSSHSQRDVSIDQQVSACMAFARDQGLEVVEIYADRAMTGTNALRPEFQRMIEDSETGSYSFVIVYTLDRFARDRYDSVVYKQQLRTRGVKVLSAMENISDDPTGVLLESVIEGLAEYYSKELARKINRGLSDNAAKCLVNGPLPFGYVRGADGRYEIQPEEAAVVREIFERVSEGDPMAAIIRDLNAREIRTKRGGKWNRSSFNILLINERYKGFYIYGNTRISGGVPVIVEPELWDLVQEKLDRKPNARNSKRPSWQRSETLFFLTRRSAGWRTACSKRWLQIVRMRSCSR